MADISTLVEESLSVSGILLGKTMGRSGELADRFEDESARLADLEVRGRMAGRWVMATIQISFAVMPALVYLAAGLLIANGSDTITIGTVVAFTTLQTRLLFPAQSLLNVGVDVQSSLALFERIFEYLDLPVELRDGHTRLDVPEGRVRFEDVWFRYEPDGAWILRGIDLDVAPARRSRSSARPVRARRRWATSSPACTTPSAAGSRSTAPTCATRRSPRWRP